MGVGRRIGVLVSTAVVATVLCVAGMLAAYQAMQNTSMKRAAIEGTAYVFASAVADHLEAREVHTIQSVLRSVDRVPGVISASVYDSTQTWLQRWASAPCSATPRSLLIPASGR